MTFFLLRMAPSPCCSDLPSGLYTLQEFASARESCSSECEGRLDLADSILDPLVSFHNKKDKAEAGQQGE